MPTVSVPRQALEDGSLPPVCVVCGADAPHRRYHDVSPPSLAWVLFLLILGLISFWIYILAGGASRPDRPAGLPFCNRHRRYWPRRAWFIVGGFVALVTLMVIGAALTPPPVPGRPDQPHWLFGVAGCWMLFFLPVFILLHLSALRPTASDRHSVTLSGASRPFAEALRGASARPADSDDVQST
jgi:hypothetical protein